MHAKRLSSAENISVRAKCRCEPKSDPLRKTKVLKGVDQKVHSRITEQHKHSRALHSPSTPAGHAHTHTHTGTRTRAHVHTRAHKHTHSHRQNCHHEQSRIVYVETRAQVRTHTRTLDTNEKTQCLWAYLRQPLLKKMLLTPPPAVPRPQNSTRTQSSVREQPNTQRCSAR